MIAALMATLALVAVLCTFIYTRSRIQEIHVLVNRRLEIALQEIRDLKEQAEKRGDK